jgi:hypothetical protein
MVAGMLRHLRSLRTMERDNGWIYTLLEEAGACIFLEGVYLFVEVVCELRPVWV